MMAIAVRTQARNVRSFAAWSLYRSIIGRRPHRLCSVRTIRRISVNETRLRVAFLQQRVSNEPGRRSWGEPRERCPSDGGTEGSNPLPSSGESSANLTSDLPSPDGQRHGTVAQVSGSLALAFAFVLVCYSVWDLLGQLSGRRYKPRGRAISRRRPSWRHRADGSVPYRHGRDHGVHAANHELTRWVRPTRSRSRIRLCKGAYKEPASIAFESKADVDANYIKLMKILMKSGIYHGMATHDENIIREAQAFATREKISRDAFEFQMLYGIRRDLQQSLVRDGWRMRVYVPFGTEWYPYFMRRLGERPANVFFIARNMLRK